MICLVPDPSACAVVPIPPECTMAGPATRRPAPSAGHVDPRALDCLGRLRGRMSGGDTPADYDSLVADPLSSWIEQTFGLKVMVVDDGEPKPLSQEARSILYRAARELLINVAGAQVILRTHGRPSVNPDEKVHLAVDPANVHLFDRASGQRLAA